MWKWETFENFRLTIDIFYLRLGFGFFDGECVGTFEEESCYGFLQGGVDEVGGDF